MPVVCAEISQKKHSNVFPQIPLTKTIAQDVQLNSQRYRMPKRWNWALVRGFYFSGALIVFAFTYTIQMIRRKSRSVECSLVHMCVAVIWERWCHSRLDDWMEYSGITFSSFGYNLCKRIISLLPLPSVSQALGHFSFLFIQKAVPEVCRIRCMHKLICSMFIFAVGVAHAVCFSIQMSVLCSSTR